MLMIKQNTAKKSITLVCIDCVYGTPSINAMYYCIKQFDFTAAKFLTSMPEFLQKRKSKLAEIGIEAVPISHIDSIEQYSYFCIKHLAQYIDTDFVLICQKDGFIINADLWNDEFLNCDYIGAIWHNGAVGNGGFSLRSKKLLTALSTDKEINVFHPEDSIICNKFGDYLKKTHDIKFANRDVANRFSYECYRTNSFGFHDMDYEKHNADMVKKFGICKATPREKITIL